MPGAHVRHDRGHACIVVVIDLRGHLFLRVVCKCESSSSSVVVLAKFSHKASTGAILFEHQNVGPGGSQLKMKQYVVWLLLRWTWFLYAYFSVCRKVH